MLTVLYGLMLCCACLMIFATIQAKGGAAWGKPAAGAAAGVAMLLVVVTVIYNLAGCGRSNGDEAVHERVDLQLNYTLTGFAGSIASACPGGKALLITAPGSDRQRIDSTVAMLKETLGSSVEIVSIWTPAEITSTDTDAQPEFSAAKLDEQFTSSGTGTNLIISLIGLPEDFQELQCLRAKTPPKIAMMNVTANSDTRNLVEKGFVQVALIGNPEYRQAETMPDAAAYFASRFIVLTPQNVKQYSSLFN